MRLSVSCHIPLPAQEWVRERDSSAFRSLLLLVMKRGRQRYEGTSFDTESGLQEVKLATIPEIQQFVPQHLQHQLAGALEYYDVIRFDTALPDSPPYRQTLISHPSLFSQKTRIELELTIEAAGPGACLQRLEGRVDVDIPGIGPIAEQCVVDTVEQQYAHLPQLLQRWMTFRRAVLGLPGGAGILAGFPPAADASWLPLGLLAELQAPFSPSTGEGPRRGRASPPAPLPGSLPGARPAGMSRTSSSSSMQSVSCAFPPRLEAAPLLPLAPPSTGAASMGTTPASSVAGDAEQELFYEPPAARIPEDDPSAAADLKLQSAPFYDAEARWHWPQERFVDDPATSASVSADRRKAEQWYADYSRGGAAPPKLSLRRASQQGPGRGASPKQGAAVGEAERRHHFADSFNEQWEEWEGFWRALPVPHAHVCDLRARLGMLFTLASQWGFVSQAQKGPPPLRRVSTGDVSPRLLRDSQSLLRSRSWTIPEGEAFQRPG